jgi:diguanylate cyclase
MARRHVSGDQSPLAALCCCGEVHLAALRSFAPPDAVIDAMTLVHAVQHLPAATATEAGHSPLTLLARVIDDYVRWAGAWHQTVFYGGLLDARHAAALRPATFERWAEALAHHDLGEQPAVDRVMRLRDRLHALADQMARRAMDGFLPSIAEYRMVIGAYEDLLIQLRRVERAFNIAASGIDPLTGLRTRQGLSDEIDREMDRLRRGGDPFCVAIADIDKFKVINDTHGHDVGDRVLEACASRIGELIRSTDDAFRMGGEEFLICLKATEMGEALQVLERVRVGIAQMPIYAGNGISVPVTTSFGVVQATPDLAASDVIVAADKALYRAKAEGRNRIVAL